MKLTFRLALVALALLLATTPAFAQRAAREGIDPYSGTADSSARTETGRLQPSSIQRVDKAQFSVQYDDGEADNGYGANSNFYDAVMRFDLGTAPVSVDEITLCFSRLDNGDPDLEFDITFWTADGTGGTPGTLIDLVRASATGVTTDLAGTYYTYDLTALGITLPNQTVYIGAGWEPVDNPDFFLCSDYDRSTVQPGYDQLDLDGAWEDITNFDPDYTALMVRGVFNDSATTGPCVPDGQTLCLNNDRFQVQVDWERVNGTTGQGQAVELTSDTGYFWFFNDANVEMVVKVLSNCGGATNRFWVFAGGLTNVEVEMVVTDTQTGQVRSYTNPLNTAFQPIQDTAAFSTCP